MRTVRMKDYRKGGMNDEYGMSGMMKEYAKSGKMPKELLEYFKKKDDKEYGMGGAMEYQEGGRPSRAYFIPGYENRPDELGMVSGRERMYVAIPGDEGAAPRVLDIQSAMKELGYESPVEMARALGVEASRGDRGFTVEGAQDPAYIRRMLAALGAESTEDLQDRLGIGRVDYERERDLPRIIKASRGGM